MAFDPAQLGSWYRSVEWKHRVEADLLLSCDECDQAAFSVSEKGMQSFNSLREPAEFVVSTLLMGPRLVKLYGTEYGVCALHIQEAINDIEGNAEWIVGIVRQEQR